MQTAYPLRRALVTNSTVTTFPGKLPLTAAPSGDGIFDIFDKNLVPRLATDTYMPEQIALIPFGTNNDDETFDMRLWGWSKVQGSDIWIPRLIAQLAIILGDIAANAVGTLHFLANTITVTDGPSDTSLYELITPTALETAASIILPLGGVQHFEFDFDIGTAATANCYWRAVDKRRQ
jgi:hypothetical protein